MTPIIDIKTTTEKDKLCIIITDNGKGIPSHILQKLGTEVITSKIKGNGVGFKHSIEKVREWRRYKNPKVGNEGITIKIELLTAIVPYYRRSWF